MKTIAVTTKTELLRHESAIERLFHECFGDRLSQALWRWAYIDNPNGEPLVSLCYDNEALVAHYGIVAMPIASSKGAFKSYLSMTTMVAASHRQHGLFVKLADTTYQHAFEAGIDFVMGFPNAMSTPGFRKRLDWTLPPADSVISIDKARLIEAAERNELIDPSRYRLDLSDPISRKWRLSRPGARYEWDDGLAYKEFKGEIDLLAFSSIDHLERIPDGRKVNLLVSAGCTELAKFSVFDYQFGGRSIRTEFRPETVAREMILSDVF